MAKRKKNKSEAIRKYMDANPGAAPQEVAKTLKVPAALVYNVRAAQKAKTQKTKGKARAGSRAAAVGAVSEVVAAAQLIKTCGGIEPARKALQAASQVASALEN